MAYLTGSANGVNALWDVIDTFIAGTPSATCAGWTKSELVASRDAIYKSTGSDGKVNIVERVFVSTAAFNPFKAPNNVHKKLPWVMAYPYSAWTVGSPGTGIKPYGQVGPVMMGNRHAGTLVADQMTMHRYNAAVLPITTPATINELFLDGRTRKSKQNESYEGGAMTFDGRRKFFGPSSLTNTQQAWQDLVHGETNLSTGGVITANNQNFPCLVHDAVNDKDVYYILNNTATLAIQWVKFDMETKTFTTLAPPTWSASATTGGVSVWDGNDTIYVLHGNTTTEFAKYSISGNSWTNLTAAPQARNTGFSLGSTGCATNMVYVPNSVTAIGEDVIYATLLASGTVIYRYDVTSNAWRSTSGTGALTAQMTIAASTFLAYDGNKTLIHGTPNTAATNWFQSDLSVAPNTWTNMGNPQTTNRAYLGLNIINHIPAKVRSHATLDTTYWMLGNLDSIIIVTKIPTPTPHYYWMYLGRFNSSNRTAIMTTTGAVVAGGRVSIPVDDSTAYSMGERIMLFDPATATSEVQNIFSIPDGSHVVINLNNNYGTGTRIGLDPTQWCAGGNGVVMVATDSLGYNTDNEPCQMIMEPTIPPEGTDRSSPGSWKLFQPNPFTLFNPDPNCSKYGNRGFLQNCGALSSGAYPKPQTEDVITINKKTYIFFQDTETASYSKDMRGLVIGPIN
jgi:hypothetical protein